MEDKKIKYAPAIVKDLSEIFAQKDSNSSSYLSGPKLVSFFNSLGFADAYEFPGTGIVTLDEEGLSRLAYTYKRLKDLNEANRIPEALTQFLKVTNYSKEVSEVMNALFNKYQLPNPVDNLNFHLHKDQEIRETPVEKPVIADTNAVEEETLSSKGNRIIDEEFDSVPPGVPVVFFSYSWDDDEHKDWVLKLSHSLAKRGIYCLLDRYLKKGYSLTRFMDKGIDRADRVIIVGSQGYLEKSKKASSGGVLYEDMIISSEMMTNIASTKFIPVIHTGSFDECLPARLSKRIGFDFRDDSKYEELVDELVRAILDVPECPRPTLGPVANYTYEDLTGHEREKLKNPQSDFRKSQDRKWLDRLLGNFSFELIHSYLTDYPTTVDGRVFISLDIWNGILGRPEFRIYDPELNRLVIEFHNIWKEMESIGSPYYSAENSSWKVKFHGLKNDVFISKEAEKAFGTLIQLQLKMQPLLKNMATYIQDNFEIDVEETSRGFIASLSRS